MKPLLFLLFLNSFFHIDLTGQIGDSIAYSFIVAGHTYGSPQRKKPGLHPPFVADFNFVNKVSNMAFGVFTGDIVFKSLDNYWDKVDEELCELPIPIYFAAGNHEIGHKEPYRKRYGRTYFSFTKGQDLIIVLNPGLGGWNIWHEQRIFLEETLRQADKYKHIFVFFHQVLWSGDRGWHTFLKPNSFDGRTPGVNFWPEIMPLFFAVKSPVFLFAGDVGANLNVTSFYAGKNQNVYMIASGMGNLKNDNYLIVEVDKKEKVLIYIRWLQTKTLQKLDLTLDKVIHY